MPGAIVGSIAFVFAAGSMLFEGLGAAEVQSPHGPHWIYIQCIDAPLPLLQTHIKLAGDFECPAAGDSPAGLVLA